MIYQQFFSSGDKKRTVPGAPMSPKTILSSAPPGTRTLDTLIKRKGI
nr:MAG TPA: hypothetical protein [Inoviridae sp.]